MKKKELKARIKELEDQLKESFRYRAICLELVKHRYITNEDLDYMMSITEELDDYYEHCEQFPFGYGPFGYQYSTQNKVTVVEDENIYEKEIKL